MRRADTPARALRNLLAGPDVVIAPGMYDALTGLLVEQAGFSCAYLGGASISYSSIGRPDIGLTSLGEVAQVVAHVRERITIPFIVDADTGFGNALNTQRAVKLLERMGASGIQLEDQTYPKRCGHLAGKSLVPTDEMVGKIKAACDARQDLDTVIIGRTDAIAVEGFHAALERAKAYASAGADVLFIEAPQSAEQLQILCETFADRVPLLANMVEGGRTPLKTAAELASMGFKLVIYPGAMMRVTAYAAMRYLGVLKADGETARVNDHMYNFSQLNAVLGLTELMDTGVRYDPNFKAVDE